MFPGPVQLFYFFVQRISDYLQSDFAMARTRREDDYNFTIFDVDIDNRTIVIVDQYNQQIVVGLPVAFLFTGSTILKLQLKDIFFRMLSSPEYC